MKVQHADKAYEGHPEQEFLVSSEAEFIADVDPQAAWQCAFVRSVRPHAKIAVHVPEQARGLVVTGKDLQGAVVPSVHSHSAAPSHLVLWSKLRQAEVHQPILALDRVLFVGQPIALVVARDRYQAEDLAEEVLVEYEELPTVSSLEAAMGESVLLADAAPRNRSVEFSLCTSADQELPESLRRYTGTFSFGRQTGAPIENRGILVIPSVPERKLAVWANTQIPHALREAIASVVGWQASDIRVRVPVVGGSFGTKGTVSAEELAVAVSAVRLARPLRWLEDRYESMCGAVQARDQVHEVTLGADAQGRVHLLDDSFTVDVGAYDPFGKSVPYNTAAHVPGPYRIPNLSISGASVLTNKTPAAPYRGSGRPEAHLARERALDRLARTLGIDALTLRERNLVGVDDMPYDTGLLYRDGAPLVYDGFDIRACLSLARQQAGGSVKNSQEGRVRIGRGCACYVATGGMGPYETASISVAEDGMYVVRTGATCQGQSHRTIFARLASDALDVPRSFVEVANSDTDLLGDGWGTMGSRSAVTAGNAVVIAATALRHQLDGLAVALSPVLARTADVPVDWRRLECLRLLATVGREVGREAELRAEGVFRPRTVTWGCGVHVATVEVDVELRAVRLIDYLATYDHGPLIDPFVVKGQMIGAIAQGIGGALCEEVVYGEDGQPSSVTLADYVLPDAKLMPLFRIFQAAASPSPANPLGLRGLGEAGTVAPAAAIASAVEDALHDLGVEISRVPITATRLHQQLTAVGL
jgi:carbon-monoxide dehydrogenase large subunit